MPAHFMGGNKGPRGESQSRAGGGDSCAHSWVSWGSRVLPWWAVVGQRQPEPPGSSGYLGQVHPGGRSWVRTDCPWVRMAARGTSRKGQRVLVLGGVGVRSRPSPGSRVFLKVSVLPQCFLTALS